MRRWVRRRSVVNLYPRRSSLWRFARTSSICSNETGESAMVAISILRPFEVGYTGDVFTLPLSSLVSIDARFSPLSCSKQCTFAESIQTVELTSRGLCRDEWHRAWCERLQHRCDQ